MGDHLRNGAKYERDEFAAYAADLTNELAGVARRHGFDALAYLLEMARMEAENASRGLKRPDGKPKNAH